MLKLPTLAGSAVVALLPALAVAHSAPVGWHYDSWCCSGRDCAPIPQEEVHVTYLVGRAADLTPMEAFDVGGLPYSVFVTADGKLAKSWLGGLSEEKLESFLQQYL